MYVDKIICSFREDFDPKTASTSEIDTAINTVYDKLAADIRAAGSALDKANEMASNIRKVAYTTLYEVLRKMVPGAVAKQRKRLRHPAGDEEVVVPQGQEEVLN